MEIEVVNISDTVDNSIIVLDEQDKTTDAESENEPLVEIKPSVFIRKSQITDLDIRNTLVKCTACGQQINHHDSSKVKKHTQLGVITCRECYSFYNSGEFTKGEDGYYNYCKWCGNGGKLFICDYCPNVFCNPCIRRNFARSEVAETEKEGWKCYCCDTEKLKPKVMFCDMILDYGRRELEKKKKRLLNVTDKKHSSPNWIKEILDEAEYLSSTFQKKLIKLKDIDKSGSKSVKRIVKKIEQVIGDHKQELKRITRTLSRQYNACVASNLNAEVCENNETKSQKADTKLDVHHVMSDINGNSNSNSNFTSSHQDKAADKTKKDGVNDKNSGRNDSKCNEKNDDSELPVENMVNDKCNEKNENVLHDHDSESLIENMVNGVCNEKNEEILHDHDSESLIENVVVGTCSDLVKNVDDNTLENHRSENEECSESKTENEEIALARLALMESCESSESSELSASETRGKIEEDTNQSAGETKSKLKKDTNQSAGETKSKLEKDTEQSAGVTESEIKNGSDKMSADKIVSESNFHSVNENSIDDFQVESTVRRKLDFSSYSSDISSDISVGSIKKFKRLKKRIRKTHKDDISISSNKSKVCNKKEKGSNQNPSIISTDDPKLKKSLRVVLDDYKDKLNGRTTINISEIDDDKVEKISDTDIDKIEKEVDNLHKFSVTRSKQKVVRDNEKKVKSKSSLNLKKNKIIDSDSSSSICLSSLEEDGEKEEKKFSSLKNIDANVLARNELMKSDSSSEDSSSSDSEVAVKRKKNVSKSKKETDSSGNDFLPSKKKKYDKLLHKRLLSDDDSDFKQNKSEIGKKKQIKRKIDRVNENKERSDSSHTTTSDSDSSSSRRKDKTKPKKRRRIKSLDSSSDEKNKSDKDNDPNSQGTPSGKGRKNIKKIISQKKLAVETKEAQELEKERKRRIQERQRLYNKIEDISEDGKEVITRKFVLEVDQSSKEEVVEIHPDLVQKLKPHQVNGVKFLWECTIESLKDLDKPGSGCILAHCMGLGKSLQVIAFVHTCLTNKYVKKVIKTAMIICPFNTALNWENEFEIWLSDVEGDIKVHQLATAKTNYLRFDIISWWQKDGGVLIVSYDLFRRLAATRISGLKKDKREKLHELLIDPGPDIVVCDEGHILKNESSAISKAVSQLRTSRRIVLTGTPLQNNLKEYHCMLTFVKPNLLGTSKEFRNRFVNPIMNGQYGDSDQRDVKLMKKRIHILHKLLDGCVQRCDYSALSKFLPPKHEFVISVKMSDVQMKMYQCYLDKLSNAKNEAKISGTTLFTDFTALRCIWTHPYLCEESFRRAEMKRIFQDDDEEMDDFINDNSDEESESKSSGSASNKEASNSDDEIIKTYRTRSRRKNAGSEDDEVVELDVREEEKQWYHEFISEEDKYKIEISGKMVLFMAILKECESIGDKILVFSQSLLTLDLIEDVLGYLHDQADQVTAEPTTANDTKSELPNQYGTWLKGIDYFRMDGSTSAENRKSFIDMFNNLNNDRARLFLISTRAGSLGTNLVGANRVIIMDTSWNPSHDVQAIFRVYRFGQVKPVYIYRLLAQGTMEEKIYERQVTKLSLSIRVVDEQQIDRHFSADDLAALYTFTPDTRTDRPTPMIPKDRLLAEMLIKHKDSIITYHEHDSLLQNETEEDLTEEERKTAWVEYENEREGQPLNTGLNTDDIKIYYEEPDFTQATYPGNLIPDLQTIVNKIATILIKQHAPNSMAFFKQLLLILNSVKVVFQGKQVKLLRMKQEYFKRGSVPESVNKYLGEVNNILLALRSYVERVSQTIINAENGINPKLGQNANQPRAQNPNIRPQNIQTNANLNQSAPQMRMQPPLNSQFVPRMGYRYQQFIRPFNSANMRAAGPGNPRFVPAGNVRSFPGNVTYIQLPMSRAEMSQLDRNQKSTLSSMRENLAAILKSQSQKDKEPTPIVTEADEFILPDVKDSENKKAAESGTSSVVIEEIE